MMGFKTLVRTLTIGATALGAVALAQSGLVDGQVTEVDQAASEITIDHAPIKKFDMGGMTMVFRVKDPAILKSVKAGDKVRFEVDRIDGQFTVTKIERAK
jgi:Cu/Ag efflux protein CusF